jgi:hypothetical protein
MVDWGQQSCRAWLADPQDTRGHEQGNGAPPIVESPHLSVEPATAYLRPVPVYRHDMVIGLQVYPGTQAALFSKWGRLTGDVITDLDGQRCSTRAERGLRVSSDLASLPLSTRPILNR